MDKIVSIFNATVIAETLALLGAIILLRKNRGWLLFLPFLLFLFLIEMAGGYLRQVLKVENGWLYNAVVLVTPIFYLHILAISEYTTTGKKFFYGAAIAHVIFFSINILFVQGYMRYNSYTQVFCLSLLIICSFLMLAKIMVSDVLINPIHDDYFWLASALAISSLGKLVLNIFKKDLDSYFYETHVNVYRFINYIPNVILYSFLIFAFICHRRKTTL